MPPKRRTTGTAPKATQSTLAFHGALNKVTKPGQRAQNAKKNIADQKATKPVVADISIADDEEPTTAEAAIIEQTKAAQKAASTPEEEEAERITDERISNYWTEKETPRKAPRVHQKDLSIHERILREFDMSGQYGPSTGITRLKRWKRAQRLNLHPPIEVLAVLLKEQEGDDKISVQRSHVDELLHSRSVELDMGA